MGPRGKENEPPLLLFDGDCGLCTGLAGIIQNAARGRKIIFELLQSAKSKKALSRYGLETGKRDSIVLIRENRVYLKSDAVLGVLEMIRSVLGLLSFLRLVPSPTRNWAYGWVARNRGLFRKSPTCRAPFSKTAG